jgi:hypothetical protein
MGAAVHSLRFRRQAIVGIIGAMVTLLAVPLALRAAAKSDPVIQQVGPAAGFASASTAAPKTVLPSGVAAGDVLVSYIETPANATIACAAGWTKQFDRANTAAHLVACTTVAGASQAQPSATVTPATHVSMTTLAYSGVDTVHPVATAAAAAGLITPTVTPTRAGSLLVLGQGSDHWRVTFVAPTGATRVTHTNDGAGSELAAAIEHVAQAGKMSAGKWTHLKNADAALMSDSATIAADAAKIKAGGGAAATKAAALLDLQSKAASSTSIAGVVVLNPQIVGSTTTTQASTTTTTTKPTGPPPGPGAPTEPPAVICGNNSMLNGPATAPAGAVTLPAGNNGSLVPSPNKTYWFAPGVHTLGTGPYNQIIPENNDWFVGAPGAVLDGQNENNSAFTQHATGVTISYLTIRNFTSPLDQGVVNHDSGNNWTIANNSIIDNDGAALMAGANNVIRDNCLADNGQYGINAYQDGDGISNLVVDHNEIAVNNTGNTEKSNPGCGCSGGVKFWAVKGATITDNYVHDNKGVGLWADTNNQGMNFQGNYIANNDDEGLFYEISYNAAIHDNTFVRNGLVKGPTNPGFPTGAIYLSESGGDSRVNGGKYATLDISGNVFTDNWSGVIMWENADRFCGSPANTSGGDCTLVDPSVANLKTCTQANVGHAPYYDDCRWKTQNVSVHDNTFNLTASHITACKFSNGCGFNGIFSNWGTYPSWSPYKAAVIENAISFHQNNVFAHNTYTGGWEFMLMDQSGIVNLATWQAAPAHQDIGSTMLP